MEIAISQLTPGDPRLVDAIVSQLKSKGIFDRLRNECLADVDTKPAFVNLKLRVDSQVKKFLETKTWKSDLNKNHFRDGVRKNIQESSILDSGIDAIINQVVNPKIKPFILPYVEDTVYGFLQIEKPTRVITEPQMPVPVYEEQPPPPTGQILPTAPHFIPQATPFVNPAIEDSNGEPFNRNVEPVLSVEKMDSVSSCESEISVGGGRSPIEPQPKEAVMPMETDVISSEEDYLLAHSSPDKSDPSKTNDVTEDVVMNEDNAVDSFDGARNTTIANATESVITAVEKLNLKEEPNHVPDVKEKPLVTPLFDNKTLDSISSNSSGLSFSPKKSSGDEQAKIKVMADIRSGQSTPLEDEKSRSSQESSDCWPAAALPKELSNNRITIASFGNFGNSDKVTIIGGASPVSTDVSQDTIEKNSFQNAHSLASTDESQDKKSTLKSEGEVTGTGSSSSNSSSTTPEPPKQTAPDWTREKSSNSSSHKHRRSRSKEHSKHGKSKSKDHKHSKSKHDDHASHRDKDKKHHRRDRDDDDKDRDKHSSRRHHTTSHGSSSMKSTPSGDSKDRKERSSDHHRHKSRSSDHHDSHKNSSSSSRRESTSTSHRRLKTPEKKSESKLNVSKTEEAKIKENQSNKATTKSDDGKLRAVNGELIVLSKAPERKKVVVVVPTTLKEDQNFLIQLNTIKKKVPIPLPISSQKQKDENIIKKIGDSKLSVNSPKIKDEKINTGTKLMVNSPKLKNGRPDKLVVYNSTTKFKDGKSNKIPNSKVTPSPKLKERKDDLKLSMTKKVSSKTPILLKKKSPRKKL